MTAPASAALDVEMREFLRDILGLSTERAESLTDDSGLFGELPEFDSMAVAAVLTGLEDVFHIQIDDDEVEGEIFETFGNLRAFVENKRAA